MSKHSMENPSDAARASSRLAALVVGVGQCPTSCSGLPYFLKSCTAKRDFAGISRLAASSK
eukprot:9478289-Alexandrium_andersonii.AAC.1